MDVVQADAVEDLPTVAEFWIPVIQYQKGDVWWSTGQLHRDKIKAEYAIKNWTGEIHDSKLVRVVLPV